MGQCWAKWPNIGTSFGRPYSAKTSNHFQSSCRLHWPHTILCRGGCGLVPLVACHYHCFTLHPQWLPPGPAVSRGRRAGMGWHAAHQGDQIPRDPLEIPCISPLFPAVGMDLTGQNTAKRSPSSRGGGGSSCVCVSLYRRPGRSRLNTSCITIEISQT